MRIFPVVLAAALLLGGTLVTTDASAERIHEDYSQEMKSCAYASAEVARWAPGAGPAASFIADGFMSHGGSLWMALGYDDKGFWTAEGYSADACDDCDRLSLVHTTFDGKRRSFSVVDADLRAEYQGKERSEFRDGIKGRLFSLAAKSWPVGELKHDYALALPKHDTEGKIEKFTGWLTQVSKKDGFLLRYATVGHPHMCWCDTDWTAYTLASPKPKR